MQARVLLAYLFVCLKASEIGGSIVYFCSQPNEVFLECGCHRSCWNPSRTCDGICQKGCFCKGEHLRDEKGDCVDPKLCPEKRIDEFVTPEPYSTDEHLISEDVNTLKPRREESQKFKTKKLYTLEPYGKFGGVTQTIKLYTYNPLYGEGLVVHNNELYALNPRTEVPLSHIKDAYLLQLENKGGPHPDGLLTSKPRDKLNVITYHKLYSKSRDEGRVVSQNKELDPIKPPVIGNSVLPKYHNPSISPNKELYKSKSLRKGSLLAQNKELYTSKSRGKSGPVSNGKELYKMKSLYKEGPLLQNIELYASKYQDKGDALIAIKLNPSESRGKIGSEFTYREFYNSKSLGIGYPLSQNKDLLISKAQAKWDSVSPKKIYTSKSLGKPSLVSLNKALHTSDSQSKGAPVSPDKELHTSKASGIASGISNFKELNSSSLSKEGVVPPTTKLHAIKSVVSNPKELYTFKSHGERKPNQRNKNITKFNGNWPPAHTKSILHDNTRCPPNEEFQRCAHCNRTCEDPKPICRAECMRGCFCTRNLLRDVDGSCVQFKRCSNIWKRMKRMNNFKKVFYAHG